MVLAKCCASTDVARHCVRDFAEGEREYCMYLILKEIEIWLSACVSRDFGACHEVLRRVLADVL